jgi:hypothetical protein
LHFCVSYFISKLLSYYSKVKVTEPSLARKPTATVTPKPESPDSSPIKSSLDNEEPEGLDFDPKDKSINVNVCDIKPWKRVDIDLLKVMSLPDNFDS